MNKKELRDRVDLEVGSRVSALRRRRTPQLSQNKLALRTNDVLTRSAIANIESGRQRVAVYQLFALAKALNVDCSVLLPTLDDVFSQRSETERKVLEKLQEESA